MKNRGKELALLTAGVVLGAALVGPAAQAVAALTAEPSTQTFYVDGRKVDLEAYAIQGHNYVQLRDVGKAMGFAVDYDSTSNSVRVDSSKPYSEEAPPSPQPPPGMMSSSSPSPMKTLF